MSGVGKSGGVWRRHPEFLELLQAPRRRWPRGRVRLEVLPLHASWLNQIERWFSVLERQCPTRASLRTFGIMAARIGRFIDQWNRTARPFPWTFKGYPLRR